MPGNHRRKRPAPAYLLRHLATIVAVLIIAGCSGGGCGGGGCSSCGGVQPLTNGFDVNHRIENAGSVRLTRSGLDFLQNNLGTLAKGLLGGSSNNGVLTFSVPKSSGSTAGIDYTVCPGGPKPNANPPECTAEIDIGKANLKINPASPYNLKITGTLPLRLQKLPLNVKALCAFGGCLIDTTVNAALNGDANDVCPGGIYDQFPVDVDIEIHVDQNPNHTARFGYSQVKVNQIFNKSDADANLGKHIHFCGGVLGSVLDAVKGLVIGQLTAPLTDTLKSQIDDQLCTKATPTSPCPTGTTADGSGICRYNGDPAKTCASILLGTDGHADLGGLLASISPGVKGGLDFLFAAGGPGKSDVHPAVSWGDLDGAPYGTTNGVTLGLFGGAEANPLSKCVKMSDLALPTGIPIPTELYGETIAGWPAGTPGPHVGIALSERFANYALNGVYNSGLLCLGISTESIDMLSSGTLGLLAPSSKDLGLQRDSQQVAIVIRPGAPPTITFGNGTDIDKDPNLRVKLNKASLDFYLFSLERFIRFMTATFDLDVPVNLTVSPKGLTPVIKSIGVSNGVVTNNQLLREKPDALAGALGDLLGSLVGQQLGGSLSAIDLNSSLASLGIKLLIPDTVDGQGSPGLRKLTKVNDNYLGIFASFGLAGTPAWSPSPHPQQLVAPHTNAQVTAKRVDREGLKFETLRRDNVPVVDVMAVSTLDDGTRAVEYQYKVDNGFWHPYTRNRFMTIKDPWLRVQGRHTVHVRSKVVGEPETLDETPAQVEVVIDAEPPSIKVATNEDGTLSIDAKDLISDDPLVRYRLDKGAWSSWTRASQVKPVSAGEAAEITIEAKDNEGNVGTATQGLIRGRPDASTAAGCGCTTVGSDRGSDRSTSGSALALLGIALAGVASRLFRRRAGEAPKATTKETAKKASSAARRALGGFAAIAIASTWAGCNCGDNGMMMTGGTTSGGTTTSSSSGGGCETCVKLEPGLVGSYTSVAADAKGDLWIAGYSEADWGNSVQYGDLVIGKWDGTKVVWNQADGVPSTPEVDPTLYDVTSFRGGQTEPGDDVGLWTSIALDTKGNPAVSYYDRTHRALKFAQYDGKSWSTQTVETKANSDIGRYSKLLFLNNGWTIAYQSVEPGGAGGALISKVRLATAGATPSPADWKFEDAAVSDTTPCRASLCGSGQACVASTKVCVPAATGCSPSCPSGQSCVDMGGPKCAAVFGDGKLDSYPDAIGGYIALAPDGQGGVGIAYYDRPKGNLMIAQKSGGKWGTLLVDGQDAMGNDTGDVGIGTTLSIDAAGDWHIAYVNGFSESLQYVKVTKGTTVGKPETVDDGLSLGGTPFDDGQHLVGDDAHILVMSGGDVHVSYQDATAGTLHYAVGTAGANGHTWTVKVLQQDGFAGAFSTVLLAGGKVQVVNWWRQGGSLVKGDVRVLTP